MTHKIPYYCDYVVCIKSLDKKYGKSLLEVLNRCNIMKEMGKYLLYEYDFSEIYCANNEINLIFRYEDEKNLMDNYVQLLNGNIMIIVTQLISETSVNCKEVFCGNLFLFEKKDSLNNWLKKKQLECYYENLNTIFKISMGKNTHLTNLCMEEILNEYGILESINIDDKLNHILNGSLISMEQLLELNLKID